MDGVELALGGAEAAADALVLVDLGSAAAKAQREASLRICSSVKVRRSLEKVLAFAAS